MKDILIYMKDVLYVNLTKECYVNCPNCHLKDKVRSSEILSCYILNVDLRKISPDFIVEFQGLMRPLMVIVRFQKSHALKDFPGFPLPFCNTEGPFVILLCW